MSENRLAVPRQTSDQYVLEADELRRQDIVPELHKRRVVCADRIVRFAAQHGETSSLRYLLARTAKFSRKVLQFRQTVVHRKNRLRIIDMHAGNEA